MESTHPVKVLAVSFYYPPANNPRAIQVSRLLNSVRLPFVLFCSSYHDANDRRDSGGSAPESGHTVVQVPFEYPSLTRFANRTVGRVVRPFWNDLPDDARSWKASVVESITSHLPGSNEASPVLVTFGSPMSDHLIGLELKRKYGLPWLAFFSDPWTDNPFKKFNSITRKVNLTLERDVMEAADRLLFTSEETIDLVVSKYPAAFKQKSRVLPHSYVPSQYSSENPGKEITIRFLGDMYGPRTPRPLFSALLDLVKEAPESLQGIRFEFVGSMCELDLDSMGLSTLPGGLVVQVPTVSNKDSLKMMCSSDALMVIDAPAEKSVFLPSKLIDYLGAAKPIIGITPPGTAARLIESLGGWVADPSDNEGIKRALRSCLQELRSRRESDRFNEEWGEPSIRKQFEVDAVAGRFESLVNEVSC